MLTSNKIKLVVSEPICGLGYLLLLKITKNKILYFKWKYFKINLEVIFYNFNILNPLRIHLTSLHKINICHLEVYNCGTSLNLINIG